MSCTRTRTYSCSGCCGQPLSGILCGGVLRGDAGADSAECVGGVPSAGGAVVPVCNGSQRQLHDPRIANEIDVYDRDGNTASVPSGNMNLTMYVLASLASFTFILTRI